MGDGQTSTNRIEKSCGATRPGVTISSISHLLPVPAPAQQNQNRQPASADHSSLTTQQQANLQCR